jgi:pimeloyl-ACP methyl ester carboxylesterase/DNA-binding CsgD family transcriptional regulator
VLKRVEYSFPAILRERLAEGRPALAILDGWATLESSLRREPEALTAAFREAAQFDAAQGSATVAPRSALGFAVVEAGGDLAHADADFRKWFGAAPDLAAFRRLIRLALKDGQASGLVEAANGAALAVCAGVREAAVGWPLPAECRLALAGPARRVVLLCFAPSRAGDLAARAAGAFGLTPLEARLVEALLDAPNLEAAASRIGVGRETAREALKKAMKKAGARRSPDLVRRMMDLMCGDHPVPPALEAVLASSFGATAAEARAAAHFARGLTAREVAEALGVKETTVRGQLKAVFAKTGVGKARDLVRLAAEASTLAALTGSAETVLEIADPNGRLRVIASGDRRIALTDYGPRSGRPVIVMHGAATGRRLPPALVRALHGRGYRPIVPQRPGYGLTDVAEGPYLNQGAEDMARVLDALRIDRAKLLVRDSSTPTGLLFASRHADRVSAGVAINPKLPYANDGRQLRLPTTTMGAIAKALAASPQLIGLTAEIFRRQTRTDLMEAVMRRVLADVPSDRAALLTPGVLDALVRDAQGMFARSSLGFSAEQQSYAAGWAVPQTVGGERWTVAECDFVALPAGEDIWGGLPNVRFHTIPNAGLLVYFTHPAAIADLVAEA